MRKAQAEAGDVVLLDADESEAPTHPYPAKAWAERGADLRVPAPGPARKVALMGAFDAARAHWLSVEWLPKYAPELNDIERVWHDLKAHHLAHRTFVDAEALDSAIHQAVDALNTERIPHPLGKQRIPA